MNCKKILFFLSLLSFIFVADAFAAQTEWEVPFFAGDLQLEGRVAVVLGAGPAGLLAAKAILHSNQHDYVIIVERRRTFSRFNLVNFFPESWPILTDLGVAQVFRGASKRIEKFDFYFKNSAGQTNRLTKEPVPSPEYFNYRDSVKKIFLNPLIGFDVINLAELQYELANKLTANQKVRIIRGTGVVSSSAGDDSLHTIEIRRQTGESSGDTTNHKLRPDLIVIAEGAHSDNRSSVGIQMRKVLETQRWCSGSVSLASVKDHIFEKLLKVIDKGGQPSVRTFGIFNARDNELFLNGVANEGEEHDACLKRNAFELIWHACTSTGYFPFSLIADRLEIIRKAQNQNIIEITPSKASRFYSGTNVIITGDAAGNGSPHGGIGLSLVTTVYAQALLDLLEAWQETDRDQALIKYNQRVSEIVDYWHARMQLDSRLVLQKSWQVKFADFLDNSINPCDACGI
ncbi:MAG TPA: FAD-dependent monooxygenase [Myxococcota bacterium]|nr:FAD-dependent monooxygenase [Myxococcota bacterium]